MPFKTVRRVNMNTLLAEIEDDFKVGRVLCVTAGKRNPHGDREGDVCFEGKAFYFEYVVSQQDPTKPIPLLTQAAKKILKKVAEVRADQACGNIFEVYYADMDTGPWTSRPEVGPKDYSPFFRDPAEKRQETPEGEVDPDVSMNLAHKFERAFAFSDVAWEKKEILVVYRCMQHIVPGEKAELPTPPV